MVVKRINNDWVHSRPEDNQAVEQAFLRLGDVLSEIASDSGQDKPKFTDDRLDRKRNLAQSSQSLDDGE